MQFEGPYTQGIVPDMISTVLLDLGAERGRDNLNLESPSRINPSQDVNRDSSNT